MTECERFEELISAYVDGEIGEAEKSALMAHVAACESCAALLNEYAEIHGAFGGDEEPPAELAGNIMAGVRRINAARKRKKTIFMRILPAAACFAVVIFAARLAMPKMGKSAAPESPAMFAATTDETAEENFFDAGGSKADMPEPGAAKEAPADAQDITGEAVREEPAADEPADGGDNGLVVEPAEGAPMGEGSRLEISGLLDDLLSGKLAEEKDLPEGFGDVVFVDDGTGAYVAYVPGEWLEGILAFSEERDAASAFSEGGGKFDEILLVFLP